jgi:hypothetical protein
MPEDLVVNPVNLTVSERPVYRAVIAWIWRAISMRMMVHIMSESPAHVFEPPAENRCGGRVTERDLAVEIQAINTLTGRVEDELVLCALSRVLRVCPY